MNHESSLLWPWADVVTRKVCFWGTLDHPRHQTAQTRTHQLILGLLLRRDVARKDIEEIYIYTGFSCWHVGIKMDTSFECTWIKEPTESHKSKIQFEISSGDSAYQHLSMQKTMAKQQAPPDKASVIRGMVRSLSTRFRCTAILEYIRYPQTLVLFLGMIQFHIPRSKYFRMNISGWFACICLR